MMIIGKTLRGAVATAALVSFLGVGSAAVAQTSTDQPAVTGTTKPAPQMKRHIKKHALMSKKAHVAKHMKSTGAATSKASQPKPSAAPQGGAKGY